ncbi:MAG: extracellular solute-binding protein [Acetanaerobacterium sp.]
MKSLIKKAVCLLMVSVMGFAVISCANGNGSTPVASNDQPSPSSEPAAEPVTLTLWHQSVGETDPSAKILTELVDQWNSEHPDVQVEEDGVTGEQYKTKIKTALAGGDAPDVFYMWGGSFVQPYIKSNNLLCIDDYLAPDVLTALIPGTIEGCKVDGKTYSLPCYTHIANLYCNTELFDQAGAKLPTTYDELLDAVAALNQADITPIVLGEKDRWPGMYWFDIIAMRQAGNDGVMAALKDPSLFNSEDFIAAAAKVQEMADAGAFNDSMFSMSYDEMLGAFNSGTAAMIFQANWVDAGISDPSAATSGKVQAIPFPEFADGKGNATEFFGGGVDGYYINQTTESPQQSVDFLSFFSQNMGRQGYLAGAGLPCWNAEGLDTSVLSDLDQQVASLMDNATSFITWWDNILPADSAETHKNLLADLYAKNITPEEFCEQMSQLAGSELS